MKYYPLMFILLVLSFGCIIPFFGQDVLDVQENVETEGPKDAVVIKDIETIPSPPILPSQETRLFFNVENRDDLKKATNVDIHLFNPSSFDIIPDEKTNKEGKQSLDGPLLPGEQQQIVIQLQAPSEEKTASVKLETDLSFTVAYDYESVTIMEALIVDLEEILTRQRQGQSITLERNNIIGSGPIQVDGQMQGVPYILDNQPGTAGIFLIQVVNRGDTTKGNLVNGKIAPGDLVITFPTEIGTVECPEDFSQSDSTCTNSEEIELFSGESNTFRFNIVNSPNIEEPFRTHNVRATIKYRYELLDSVHVIVNPLQNVG